MTDKNKYVAISLFSGCGGLDIGCNMAGVPVIAAIEIDSDAVETLKRNKEFDNCKIYNEDICNINIKSLQNDLKQIRYEKLILIGGPPCQPFSKAGYWIGNKNRKVEDDPRNMFDQYFRMVKELRPYGFLLENVESILHPSNKHIITGFIDRFSKLGYDYRVIRAYAPDFGVPQKRKRVFIIATKCVMTIDTPQKTHCNPEKVLETGLLPYVKVGDVIKKYDNDKYFEKEEVTINGTYGRDLLNVPPGKNYIAISDKTGDPNAKFKAGKRFWSFLLKLDPNELSWTIAAQPGPWVGPFHWTSRRLRVPEIAAIQTFPESYKFFGSRRSIQKQIGNAVPPLLGKAMVSFLLENINNAI